MNTGVFAALFATFMGLAVVFLSIYAANQKRKKTGGDK